MDGGKREWGKAISNNFFATVPVFRCSLVAIETLFPRRSVLRINPIF